MPRFSGGRSQTMATAAIPGALTLLILLAGVREAPSAVADARPPRLSWRELDPPLRRFLPILALFTLGNATDAFLLVRAQQLGVPLALLPALWAAHHVVKMLASVPGGAAADRFGERRAIVLGWVLYAGTYLGFALAATPLHAWALFLVYGVFYGLTEAPEKALVAACAAPERRGAAFGAYHFAVGIAALPASVLFGLAWQHVSAPAAFGLGAALALLAALLLLVAPMPARVDA